MIVGIDEVGRGSWAGPLCVAAVAWPKGARLKGLNDSKLVPAAKRVILAAKIRKIAPQIGIGWASASFIDKYGLTFALRHAAKQAMAGLADYEKIIVDGNLKLLDDPRANCKIKADLSVPAVMAASIIAKVARDSYMRLQGKVYADYNFARHVGYGTKQHRTILGDIGPCVLHRFSYAPIKALAP